MPADPSWRPTASLENLHLRAELLHAAREFFRARGFLEVETPVLSRDVVVDAWLEPFVAPWLPGETAANDAPRDELFLQTSPEFAMKRLLAAGATALFQVARVMRQGELGPRHNPEFTMLEWYRVGDSHHEQMTFTEELVRHVVARANRLRGSSPGNDPRRAALVLPRVPFERLAYDAAFARHAGGGVLSLPTAELARRARDLSIDAPHSLSANEADRDEWLNLLLARAVEPHLGRDAPQFLYDYPASQAALARVRDDDPPVAERFELYVGGVELCNGYHELTDPEELRRRIAVQASRRAAAGRRELPAESRLLAAMRAGLPACSGVALGFDRLTMLALGAESLAEVIAFPFERA